MAARTQAFFPTRGFLVAFGMLLCSAQLRAETTPPATANSTAPGTSDAAPPAEADMAPKEGETRTIRRNGIIEETRSATVGVQDILNFEFVPRSGTPGNPKVLQVEPNSANPKQIMVTPVGKGSSSLTITDVTGRVRFKYNYTVTDSDLSQKVMAIRDLLRDVEGIYVRVVDNKIVIDGELIVPRDYDRILKVIDAYKGDIIDLVSISRLSMEAIARKMQEEINKEPGGVNVTVRLANETFFLLGTVDSPDDRSRAELIAKTYLPDKQKSFAVGANVLATLRDADRPPIQNLIVVPEQPPPPPQKMVRVTVHFVEIGKEFLKSSFFKWAPLMQEGSGLRFGQSTTGGITTSSNGSFAGTISNLLPKLQSGSNGGFARVLYSTVGLGVDGKPIELRRSDQVPVIEVMNGVPNTAKVDSGLQIKVTPNISGEDRVTLDTEILVRAIAGAGASAGSGSVRTAESRFTNTLIVRSGESAVIGGLVSNDTAKDVDKDPEAPATSGNPLFTLLRSKAFRNKKTQFVIFVSPKIVSDAAAETADIKAKIINNNKQRKRTLK